LVTRSACGDKTASNSERRKRLKPPDEGLELNREAADLIWRAERSARCSDCCSAEAALPVASAFYIVVPSGSLGSASAFPNIGPRKSDEVGDVI